MLNSLKKIFQQDKLETKKKLTDLHLLCGLMIEAANIDGHIHKKELNKISKVLISTFKENPEEIELEMKKCLEEINDHKSLHYFTSKINNSFSNDKKLLLLQTLWEIILEDGKIHDFESNIIRRLAGLLYISDIDCGKAKKIAISLFKEGSKV